ncbi:Hsp20/alpha crystallin family protein [Calderihabitans maritimus]|uniref:Molecular chaperone n=1 Tax=Calderihabitans maritimus TaxID=1246530 RepID=A0A1Z5HVW5_9FIRM|nr:Hsp20/alpha crystallin family protein [Calderihabitans maritimus]GAW93664.1 molecular chaperone [Calderihabitans maritimus]
MALVRWDPLRELSQLRNQMNQVFERLYDPFMLQRYEAYEPKLDVYETDTEVIATAEIPGLENKEDLQVSVTEDSLSIQGELKRKSEIKEQNFYRSERFFGTFSRTIPLPARVEPDKAKAFYKNGILEVRIPKVGDTRKKIIPVDIH